MDYFRKPAQARREKRQSSSKKAPYARPESQEAGSSSTSRSNHKARPKTPFWRKRLERFVNPWRQDSSDEEDEVDILEDNKTGQPSIDGKDQSMDQEDNGAGVSASREAIEIDMEDNASNDDNASDAGNTRQDLQENSQETLVASSLENSFVRDESFAEDSEDVEDATRRSEREESLISGYDSDAALDRKDSRKSRKKKGSRSSTPVRSTRRTTRSQAARVDEISVADDRESEEPEAAEIKDLDMATIEQETVTTTTTIEQVVETVESIEPVVGTEAATEDQPQPSTKSKGSKKKKKGSKKRSKGKSNIEVEELEQQLEESDERIADKIKDSQRLIDESEDLLQEVVARNEKVEHVLAEAKDPFSANPDDEDNEDSVQADEEDQTFHSTSQFEAEDQAGESLPALDFEESRYYTSQDEDEEDPNTVKFYPPEALTNLDATVDDSAVDAVEQEETEQIQIDADQERSPSPERPKPIPESVLMAEDYEFSPMQSRTPSPPLPEPTTPSKDQWEDCPTIETPKATRTAPVTFSPEQSVHPSHNIDFLASFFERQKGHMLTRVQAEQLRQLIDDSVMPSSEEPWLTGEEDVSFRNPSTVPFPPSSGKEPTLESSSSAVPQAMPSSAPQAGSPARIVRKVGPFEVKRQAISDLYHEAQEEASKRLLLPPMDEYLEIKKYEGVQWDDLPNHVKVKRFLEWKGPEPPEAVRKRELEYRQKKKAENAKIWGQDEEKKKEAAAIAQSKEAVSLKRTVSTSGMFSDEEDDTSVASKKTLRGTTPAHKSNVEPIPVPAKVSSVAQKLLDIVGKGSSEKKVDEKESPASPKTAPASALSKEPEVGKPLSGGVTFGLSSGAPSSSNIFAASAASATAYGSKLLFSTPAKDSNDGESKSTAAPSFSFALPGKNTNDGSSATTFSSKTTITTSTSETTKTGGAPAFNFGIPATTVEVPKSAPLFTFGGAKMTPGAGSLSGTGSATGSGISANFGAKASQSANPPKLNFGFPGNARWVEPSASDSSSVQIIELDDDSDGAEDDEGDVGQDDGEDDEVQEGGEDEYGYDDDEGEVSYYGQGDGGDDEEYGGEYDYVYEDGEQEDSQQGSEGYEDEEEEGDKAAEDDQGTKTKVGSIFANTVFNNNPFGVNAFGGSQASFGGSSQSKSGATTTNSTFSTSGFSSQGKVQSGSSFFSTTTSSPFSSMAPKTPEFSFDFGQSAKRISTIARPGSPTGRQTASFASSFASSTPATFSSTGPITFGNPAGFGQSGQDKEENTRKRTGRGSESDSEMSPLVFGEEGFDTEEGTVSPFPSPVLSPRSGL